MSVAPQTCPSMEDLERVASGGDAPDDLRAHLKACDACRHAVERIRDDNGFLSGFAVDGALPRAPRTEALRAVEIPGYELVREIHRGGQGVVYQAIHGRTRRPVAIKVMKQGPFATLADRARFTREIEILGRLDHPNIVAIHDAGVAEGFQYFVMNYVDGQPLDLAILDFGTWNLESEKDGESQSRIQNPKSKIDAIVRVFIKVCDAVHAAHLRGVMHRDLKPSNVLVDRRGEPYVLDFGLAKATDARHDSAMTRTGQFVGSLPWASPEQVEGSATRVDLRTDVYSLGAMLFQLLTGRLPFDVDSGLREAVDRILVGEPPRPSAVAAASGGPAIDDDLDTIVLKCLSKDRDRRYQSAGDLARDLRRRQSGDPIEAKRDSAIYMLRRTLRRYRLRVAVAATFVLLLGVFGGVMAVMYRHSSKLEREAVESASSLARLLSDSNIEQGRMAGLLGNRAQAENLLWRELLLRHDHGDASRVRFSDPPGRPDAYWALWELYRRHPCLITLRPEPFGVRSLTLSTDGRSLWTGDGTGLVQRIGYDGKCLEQFRIGPVGAPCLPIADPSGDLIVSRRGDHFGVWRKSAPDAPTLDLPPFSTKTLARVIPCANGRRLAQLVDDVAVVWSVEPPAEIGRFAAPTGAPLTGLGLSADGRLLATRDLAGAVRVVEIDGGREIAHWLQTTATDVPHHTGDLVFSSDNKRLADAWTALPGRVFDLAASPPTLTLLDDRPGDYRLMAFSPDGARLAIGDIVGMVRIFDARSGRSLSRFVAHNSLVRGIAFAADGRGLWTGGDGELRLWDLASEAGARVIPVPGQALLSLAVDDDRSAWVGSATGVLTRFDRVTGAATAIVPGDRSPVSCVALSPDGARIAAATLGGDVLIRSTARPDAPPIRMPHPSVVSGVAFTPDGTRIVSACDDKRIRVWRIDGAIEERALDGADDRLPQIVLDAEGRRVAGVTRSGAILLWDLASGTCDTLAPAVNIAYRAVRFTPDGRRLVTGGGERTIQIWDIAARRRVSTMTGHNQEVYCLDLSPHGELVVSGDSGGALRLWRPGDPRCLATLDGHGGAVMDVRFSPDGRTFTSVSLDGTVRIWDLDYFKRHIAGQVSARLAILGPEWTRSTQTEGWRAWSREVLSIRDGR